MKLVISKIISPLFFLRKRKRNKKLEIGMGGLRKIPTWRPNNNFLLSRKNEGGGVRNGFRVGDLQWGVRVGWGYCDWLTARGSCSAESTLHPTPPRHTFYTTVKLYLWVIRSLDRTMAQMHFEMNNKKKKISFLRDSATCTSPSVRLRSGLVTLHHQCR